MHAVKDFWCLTTVQIYAHDIYHRTGCTSFPVAKSNSFPPDTQKPALYAGAAYCSSVLGVLFPEPDIFWTFTDKAGLLFPKVTMANLGLMGEI